MFHPQATKGRAWLWTITVRAPHIVIVIRPLTAPPFSCPHKHKPMVAFVGHEFNAA
jgi:hypothetical protein